MPSLRLIQAPVFHGYSFSAWVEFEDNPGVEALESGLAMESIEVRGGDFEPPTNVGQAGQGGIAVGAIIAGSQRSRRLLVLAGGRQRAAGRRERRRGGPATRMKRFAASAIALFTAACGYHVGGHADLMPKTIKTIAIPAFGNDTTRYKLARPAAGRPHTRIHRAHAVPDRRRPERGGRRSHRQRSSTSRLPDDFRPGLRTRHGRPGGGERAADAHRARDRQGALHPSQCRIPRALRNHHRSAVLLRRERHGHGRASARTWPAAWSPRSWRISDDPRPVARRASSRNDLPPAILLLGPEAYERRRLKEALFATVPEDAVAQHDLTEVTLAEVLDDARALSLFASERLIWVVNAEAALPRGRAAADDDEGESAGSRRRRSPRRLPEGPYARRGAGLRSHPLRFRRRRQTQAGARPQVLRRHSRRRRTAALFGRTRRARRPNRWPPPPVSHRACRARPAGGSARRRHRPHRRGDREALALRRRPRRWAWTTSRPWFPMPAPPLFSRW